MKKTLGILGGMGPMATADLFVKIISMTRASCDNEHIRILIDSNARIPDRTAAILHGGPDPMPEMVSALRNLENCGADCIILPCNTAHYYLPRLQALTDTPILNMPEIAARRCAELYPGRTAAILSTTGTLATGIYDRALEKYGVPFLHPDEEQKASLMHLIYDVIKATRPLAPERESWSGLLDGLRGRGAEVFVLGCTELPMAADGFGLPGPFVDPTAELARAAILACGYELRE